jgi:hypothetical protein
LWQAWVGRGNQRGETQLFLHKMGKNGKMCSRAADEKHTEGLEKRVFCMDALFFFSLLCGLRAGGTTTFMTFYPFFYIYFRARTREKTFFPFEGLMVWSVPLKEISEPAWGV